MTLQRGLMSGFLAAGLLALCACGPDDPKGPMPGTMPGVGGAPPAMDREAVRDMVQKRFGTVGDQMEALRRPMNEADIVAVLDAMADMKKATTDAERQAIVMRNPVAVARMAGIMGKFALVKAAQETGVMPTGPGMPKISDEERALIERHMGRFEAVSDE